MPGDFKPINLDSHLGKVRSRIHLVGVELEGGWDRPIKGITGDGSVQVSFQDALPSVPKGVDVYQAGELPSPAMTEDKLEAWLKAHYPQFVNHTCGMHTHLSFRSPLIYQRLMVPEYQDTVIDYVRKWAEREVGKGSFNAGHCIFDRCAGKSPYCKREFLADGQVQTTSKRYMNEHDRIHRYTAINYCFSRFQTIECRLLPMMPTVELAHLLIKEFINVTNAFLVKTAAREEKITVGWKIEPDVYREDTIECV